ncbi:MAG: aldo/keto reductase [Deltaproteobacteria bacterium]|nr:aldo/keto reductase [Deltaproteobacteria bacterium]
MEFTKIAGTELTVSRIGLGTWAIGGWMWGGSDESDSIAAICAAVDHDINLIDTAPVYGFGRSEEILGKALASHGLRNRVVIATKVGLDWRDRQPYRHASRRRIFAEVEASLKRIGTDYIDIYQLHWPDPFIPVEECAQAMLALLKQGKIRAIGVSNFTRLQMRDFRRVTRIHTVQPPYNLFERESEQDVLPYCLWHGITSLAYGPLCRGLLSGRMRSETAFSGDDQPKIDPKFQQPRYGQYLRAVAELDRFARENYGRRVIHLALRWVLDQPGVSVALWGARRPSQLDPLGQVMGWTLGHDAMQEIDRIVRKNVTNPIGPEYMAPPVRAEIAAA